MRNIVNIDGGLRADGDKNGGEKDFRSVECEVKPTPRCRVGLNDLLGGT
jgi:hypothetical protein